MVGESAVREREFKGKRNFNLCNQVRNRKRWVKALCNSYAMFINLATDFYHLRKPEIKITVIALFIHMYNKYNITRYCNRFCFLNSYRNLIGLRGMKKYSSKISNSIAGILLVMIHNALANRTLQWDNTHPAEMTNWHNSAVLYSNEIVSIWKPRWLTEI